MIVDRERRLRALERTRHPLDAGRAGRRRHELSRTEIAEYEREAGPVLRELGYERGRRSRPRRAWPRRMR